RPHTRCYRDWSSDVCSSDLSQIGLPLVEPIKRIVVGAKVLRQPVLPSNGAVEHPAECYTIDGARMNAEPNDPARVLIHDHQDKWVRSVADSTRNRSMLTRQTFIWSRHFN